MDAFWKWLMRANARGVFGGLLAALLFVMAWWLWKAFAPPRAERIPPSRRTVVESQPSLGIVAFMDREAAAGATLPRTNPFQGPMPPRIHPPPVKPPKVEPPKVEPPKVEPPKVEPPKVEPPPPKPRETITLQYQGVYRDTSGRTAALLRDSRSGTVSFHRTGTDFSGVRVGAIHPTHVTITGLDGVVHSLKLYESTPFEVLSLGNTPGPVAP